MASLIKRGRKGIYSIADYVNGKYVWTTTGTSNRTEAEIILGEFNRNKLSKTHNVLVPGKISWKLFYEKYLKYSKSNKSRRTFGTDKATIDRFYDLFPILSVTDLNPHLLEEYKSVRESEVKKYSVNQEKIKRNTINRDIDVLKAFGRKAQEWGYLIYNPFSIVKKLKIPRLLPKFFTDKQIKNIRDAARDDFELVM